MPPIEFAMRRRYTLRRLGADNRIAEYEEIVRREALHLSQKLGLEALSQNDQLEDAVPGQ